MHTVWLWPAATFVTLTPCGHGYGRGTDTGAMRVSHLYVRGASAVESQRGRVRICEANEREQNRVGERFAVQRSSAVSVTAHLEHAANLLGRRLRLPGELDGPWTPKGGHGHRQET